MINPDAPTEVLPGFLRGDLMYLAECLEGVHGEGRRAEAAPQAARFLRAALSPAGARLRQLLPPIPALESGVMGNSPIGPFYGTLSPDAPGEVSVVLTDAEHRMILKQRAHAERNRGDDEEVPS